MDKLRPQNAPSGPSHGAGRAPLPGAAAYAERAAAKKYMAPPGGGASGPIPQLDAPHVEGMTMAAQARAARGSSETPHQGGIFSSPTPGRAQTRVLPTDMLPEEARQDPSYRVGPGSGFALAQPHLAAKYGVVRSGVRVPPSALQGGGHPEVAQQVHDVAQLNDQFQRASDGAVRRSEDAEVERSIAGGAVGAARSAASSVGGADPKIEQAVRDRLAGMDTLDLHRLEEMSTPDVLNNAEQQAIVEARCSVMTLDEYVINGFVRQRVPIVPGVFEVTFQSLSLSDELTLKNLIAKEATNVELTDRYLVDKYGYMGLTASLHCVHSSARDTVYPSHLDNEGRFNEDLFWSKFSKVERLPFHLAASLIINFHWFEVRVRRLPRASKSAGVA